MRVVPSVQLPTVDRHENDAYAWRSTDFVRVTFPNRTIRVWTYEMPDGKLEQYQVAPTV